VIVPIILASRQGNASHDLEGAEFLWEWPGGVGAAITMRRELVERLDRRRFRRKADANRINV
jgi:hypothetical protein